MPGVFGASTLPMAMGRVHRALYNQGIGTQTSLRATLGAYYGLGGSVSLYGSFLNRFYPHTY